jgi:hypothetical protein
MQRLGRFIRLGPREQWATLQAATTLVVIQALLGRAPERAWQRLVRRACSEPGARGEPIADGEALERVLRSVRRASAHLPRTTCLGRALTAWVMLRKRSIPAVVRLGVKSSTEGSFGAHAWLECGGRAVLGEPEAGQYVEFRGIGGA